MNPAIIILAVLFCTSSVLSITMTLAWRGLGRPRHALTWSFAFGIAALQWVVNAIGLLLFPQATIYIAIVALMSLTSSTLCAIGCRQRADLPNHYIGFAVAVLIGQVAVTTAVSMTPHARYTFGTINFFAAIMFVIGARAVSPKDRPFLPGEIVLVISLLLFALLELVLGGILLAQGLFGDPQLTAAYRLTLAIGLACGYIATGVAAIFLLATDLAVKMRGLALSDPLTGLLNRRGFEEAAANMVAAARRRSRPLSVVIADLDAFKAINDLHGHAVGDDVLRLFASYVAGALRSCDAFGRLGGEEFGIVLAETTAEMAMEMMNRIREQVAVLRLGSGVPVRVTSSFGVAELISSDKNVGDALSRADQALYRAKLAGRNRVMFGDPAATMPVPLSDAIAEK